MKKETPTVSVVIPVYNVEKYAEECITSVLNQSLKTIEIIIINDGSTDNSLEVINKFKDNRIKLINKKNGGLSSARNRGIQEATGEYISFLDSDDFYVENICLEKVYNFAKENNLELVECKYDLYKEDGTIENRGKYLDVFKNNIISTDKYINELININFTPVCFKLFRGNVLSENKIFFKEGFLHEDEEFTPKVLLNTKKIGIFKDKFYGYRYRENSITTTQNIKRGHDCIKICCDLLKYYDKFDNNKNVGLLKKRAVNMIIETVYIYKINIDDDIKRIIINNSTTYFNKFRILLIFCNIHLFYIVNKYINRFLSMMYRVRSIYVKKTINH